MKLLRDEVHTVPLSGRIHALTPGQLGRWGENSAALYLQHHRYVVLERNYRCKSGEVDLIARDGNTLVFVEIKTRRGVSCGTARESVRPYQLSRLSRAAMVWLSKSPRYWDSFRCDVVALDITGTRAPQVRIEHFKDVTA